MLYSPVIRSQSFDEPVSWSVNFTSTSQLSSHLRWDRMARVGWSWVFPFPWVDKALKKLQLGFGKTDFQESRHCQEQNALVYFQIIPSSLPPCKAWGFFPPAFNVRTWLELQVLKLTTVWAPDDWVPLEFLMLKLGLV